MINRHVVAKGIDDVAKTAAFQGIRHRRVQPVGAERFDDVVVRAGLHRLHGGPERRVGGDHHDGCRQLLFFDDFENLHAVEVRQVEVENGDRRDVLLKRRQRRPTGVNVPDVKAARLQEFGAKTRL